MKDSLRPLVSVIIPAYNAERYLPRALESVYGQSYRPIEVIIVDDGSTDGTGSMVEACRAGRPNEDELRLVYIRQQNAGPSRARNIGIKSANGEYVAFLDSDDLWTEDKLEKMMRLLERDHTVDIAFSDVNIRRKKGSETEEVVMFQKNGLDKVFFGHEYMVLNPLEKLLRLNFIPTSSVVAKRGCFRDDIFFNEKRRHSEDWELWLKMSLCFNFAYVSEPFVFKNENGEGLSSESFKMLLSKMTALDDFLREKMSCAGLNAQIRSFSAELKNIYKWAGCHFMRYGEKKLARDYYGKALRESFDSRTFFHFLKTYIGA